MKWIIFSLALVIVGCSPSRRIKWHVNRLEKLEERHPELFDPISIDTVIKDRNIDLILGVRKMVDTATLERLRKDSAYYRQMFDKHQSDLRLKGVKDCDSVIKAMKLSNNTQSKITTVYRQAKCVIQPKFIDTLGVQINVSATDGILDISVKVDSMHIKKDCPPIPKFVQKKYHEFWQFWAWVISSNIISCLLLIFVIRMILRR